MLSVSRVIRTAASKTKLYWLAGILLSSALISTQTNAELDPYLQPNNTWITLSGTVEVVRPNSFALDYGDGSVTVEMDDLDRDADGYKLLKGDRVTVHGKIDDDFFESTSIEAGSVYVEKLNTYFYASALDEEDFAVWYSTPIQLGVITVHGTVTAVRDTEFTINTGARTLTVDTNTMPYNPLDDVGYQKINSGDVVRVTGTIENKLFFDKVIKAQTAVVLVQ